MPGKQKCLVIGIVLALMTFGFGATVSADSGAEQGFLSKINSSRSANGLPPVSMDGNLRSHARSHTDDMIAAGKIYHSTSAELQAAAGSGWSKLGENVGRGGTVSSLHDAFMNSSGHRANILGDYNYVGIGAETAPDGKLYVTVVFMKKGSTAATTTTTQAPSTTSTTSGGSSPTTTTAPKAKPKPAPTTTSTVAPTTTIPPTTTTTLIVGPDKQVTPGQSCYQASRFGWMCHD